MKRMKLVLVSALLLLAIGIMSIAPIAAQDDPLLIWADNERTAPLQALAADFEAEFGVPVQVETIGLGEARDDLLNFGPAGEGPDILVIAHDSIGLLVANGALLPLDITGL